MSHMNSRPGDHSHKDDDYAYDKNGNPIVDRFGRPVRRRSSLPRPSSSDASGASGAAGRSPLPPLNNDHPSGRRLSDRLNDGSAERAGRGAERGADRGSDRGGRHSAPREERTYGRHTYNPEADRAFSARSESRRSESARPESPEDGRHRRPAAQPQPPQYRRNTAASGGAAGAAAAGGYYASQQGAPHAGAAPGGPRGGYPQDGYGDQGYRDEQGYRGGDIPSRREEHLRRSRHERGDERWRRPKKEKAPRKRRRFPILKTLGAIILVLLALVVGAGIWVDTSLNRTEAITKYDGRPGNTKGTNWLLVGSDSRAGLSQEDADRLTAGELDDTVGRTDTIMVVNIPTFGGTPSIISFPRDSYVNIPGHGMDKINVAFSVGGPQLLQQTIEQATGWRIDHYAEIGFGGFANLVDAVGGINMCLEAPLQDPMAGVDLQAGCQDMDGVTALGYVRSRYTSAGGDLDRAQRQRDFVAALSKKIASPGTLLNPFKLFPVIDGMTASLTVDEGDHVWHLARLGLAIAGGAEQKEIPVAGYQDLDVGNVVLWDEQGAEQLFESLR